MTPNLSTPPHDHLLPPVVLLSLPPPPLPAPHTRQTTSLTPLQHFCSLLLAPSTAPSLHLSTLIPPLIPRAMQPIIVNPHRSTSSQSRTETTQRQTTGGCNRIICSASTCLSATASAPTLVSTGVACTRHLPWSLPMWKKAQSAPVRDSTGQGGSGQPPADVAKLRRRHSPYSTATVRATEAATGVKTTIWTERLCENRGRHAHCRLGRSWCPVLSAGHAHRNCRSVAWLFAEHSMRGGPAQVMRNTRRVEEVSRSRPLSSEKHCRHLPLVDGSARRSVYTHGH